MTKELIAIKEMGLQDGIMRKKPRGKKSATLVKNKKQINRQTPICG